MWTINFIRTHLNRLPEDAVFSTRDFLCYGKRATIDSALHRLVKREVIFRLARGVFVKWSSKVTRGILPSAQEVAKTKARGFGKEIFMHKRDAAKKVGLSNRENMQPVFATYGRTSSFQFGRKRITLAHVSPKQANLGDSFAGLLIRGAKDLVRDDDLAAKIKSIAFATSKNDRYKVCVSAASMPSWLSDVFCCEKIATSCIRSLASA